MASGFIHSHVAKGATGAALSFLPTPDSEVQPYNSAIRGLLLDLLGNVSIVTLATFMQLSITQEAAYADIHAKITMQNDGVVATGDPAEQIGKPVGKWVGQDMDFTMTPDGPGSDTVAQLLNVLYGQKVYWPEGKHIYYKVTGTGDDSTAFVNFAGGVINDLDPQRFYGLAGACPIVQDQAGIAIKFTCPSFGGLLPGVLYGNGGVPYDWVDEKGEPILAGIFRGNETLTLQSASHVAQTPDCLVHLIEIGNIEAVPLGGGITAQPRQQAPLPRQGQLTSRRVPTPTGGMAGIVQGLFG